MWEREVAQDPPRRTLYRPSLGPVGSPPNSRGRPSALERLVVQTVARLFAYRRRAQTQDPPARACAREPLPERLRSQALRWSVLRSELSVADDIEQWGKGLLIEAAAVGLIRNPNCPALSAQSM